MLLVRLWICFIYTLLLHIELSNDVLQSPNRVHLPKSVLQPFFIWYLSNAQKILCKNILIFFLVCFWLSFLYPPLLHIELSNDVPRSPNRVHIPKSVLQPFYIWYLSNAWKKQFKPVQIYSLYIYDSLFYIHNYYILS